MSTYKGKKSVFNRIIGLILLAIFFTFMIKWAGFSTDIEECISNIDNIPENVEPLQIGKSDKSFVYFFMGKNSYMAIPFYKLWRYWNKGEPVIVENDGSSMQTLLWMNEFTLDGFYTIMAISIRDDQVSDILAEDVTETFKYKINGDRIVIFYWDKRIRPAKTGLKAIDIWNNKVYEPSIQKDGTWIWE